MLTETSVCISVLHDRLLEADVMCDCFCSVVLRFPFLFVINLERTRLYIFIRQSFLILKYAKMTPLKTSRTKLSGRYKLRVVIRQ